MSANLHNRGITIADADGRGGSASVSLKASRGTIALVVGTSGVTYDSGTGAAASPLVFHGTITQIDNLFRGRTTGTVIHTSASTGSVTFTLAVTDEDSLTTTITFIGMVADFQSPVLPVVSSISCNIEQAKNMHGIGYGVTDADDNGGYATFVLASNEGEYTIDVGNSGATVLTGNGSTSVTMTGTISSLNNLLTAGGTGTIHYVSHFAGNKFFFFTVTDSQGQIGTRTYQGTAFVAPTIIVPLAYLAAITSTNYDVEGKGFSYTDIDTSGSNQTLELISTGGTITVVVGTSGCTLSGATGNGTAHVTMPNCGTLAQINSLLQASGTGTIKYLRAADATETFTVKITDDTGRTGQGSIQIRTQTGTVWTNYAQATPQPTDVAISNFVVPIDLSIMPAVWWAAVAPDGRDIRVTNDSNTQVAADLVPGSFDYANKYGMVYAKIANNTAGSQPVLRVWCGASNASALAHGATYGSDAVYDTSIIKAWIPQGGGTDRTSNANSMTMTGSPVAFNQGGITGFFTAYGGGGKYGKTTSATNVEDNIPEQFAAFVKPGAIGGADATYVSSCHGTIRNLLGQNNSKVRGKTDIQSGTDNAVFSSSNVVANSWNLAFAMFYATNSRQAGRNAFVPTSDTGTSTGVAGADAYIIAGIGTDVAGTVTVVDDFTATMGLVMIFKYASADIAKFNAWMKNYAGAYAQSTYWGTWAAGTGSLAGL